MAAITASLPAIFELIRLGVPGLQHLIAYVFEVRNVLTQSDEWTVEMQSAFVAALVATKSDPAYQPDAPAAPPAP
jgi:hypothetical protein